MIGILGGTFDPVHLGHLRPALEVFEALGLEQLRLVPLRDPPHRSAPHCTERQRVQMLQAACADLPGFQVDTRELEREGKSFSVLTLESLRRELGQELPICLLMGSDAFRHFPGWHQPERILGLAHLVVMQRPGEPHAGHYPERHCDDSGELRRQPADRILFQEVSQLEISSTRIREILAAGRSPRFLLPDAVLAVIEKENLYR